MHASAGEPDGRVPPERHNMRDDPGCDTGAAETVSAAPAPPREKRYFASTNSSGWPTGTIRTTRCGAAVVTKNVTGASPPVSSTR